MSSTRIMVACLAALLLAACSTPRSSAPSGLKAAISQASGSVFVVRRDWHVDIAFAVDDMSAPLNTLAGQFPGARYLVFGFGDRRYLKSRNKHLPNMVAALWPGRGLILMTALSAEPGKAFGDRQVIGLPVSADALLAAQASVWASLSMQDGSVESEGAGPYDGSVFLDTSAHYSAVHTCNTWAAQVLRASGLPIHSTGVVFAGQLWGQVQYLAQGAP
jgi:hypothetical protein